MKSLNRAARRAAEFGREMVAVIDEKTGKVIGYVAAGATGVMANAAQAAVDYSDYTDAADFTGLAAAAGVVIVALIGVSLAIGGGLLIWNLVKRGRNG
jgi:hypothetical protein